MTPFSEPLDVAIGTSRYTMGLVLALHALAFSIAILLALNRPIFVAVAGLVAASAGYMWRRPNTRRLQIQADGRCRVWTNNGTTEVGNVRTASVFGAAAVGLTLSIDEPAPRAQRLLIVCDSVDPAVFRRLRVRMRLLATPKSASVDLWSNRH